MGEGKMGSGACALVLAIVLAAGLVNAQEQPIEHAPPYLGDCFTGCAPDATRGVTRLAYGRFPAAGAVGARCVGFCQYDGLPNFRPAGPGWFGCTSGAPVGIGCNTSVYLLDNSRPWRPQFVCDAGQIDATITGLPDGRTIEIPGPIQAQP